MVRSFTHWTRSDAVAFLVGSSVAVSIVTTLYVGIAYSLQKRRGGASFSLVTRNVPIEWITLVSSIVYGLVSVVIKKTIIDKNGKRDAGASANWALLYGALTGLAFSLVGRFGMDLPSLLFGMNAQDAWRVHVGAPVLYALVFRFYVYPVLAWALLG